MSRHVEAYPGVSYTAFLIPGLAMMSMAQNAFANSSSSLIQSKITGNIVFLLLPPLTALEFFALTCWLPLCAAWVGAGVLLVTAWFGLPLPSHPCGCCCSPFWVVGYWVRWG
jgi:ABC-2 type transport system permease protein